MKLINQFDIWLADLNPRIGTEAGKVRPVIIVQTNLLNREHPSTIICPITKNIQPDSKILRVQLRKTKVNLKSDSDIMIDQIRAIDNQRLIKKIGTVSNDIKKRVIENLKIILDLN